MSRIRSCDDVTRKRISQMKDTELARVWVFDVLFGNGLRQTLAIECKKPFRDRSPLTPPNYQTPVKSFNDGMLGSAPKI